MPDINRLSLEKSKADFVRQLDVDADYIKFDTRKELFMYAVAKGAQFPKELEEAKDALFNDRDLNDDDKAMMYSLVYSELDDLDVLKNKEKVYHHIQQMANSGIELIQDEIDTFSMGDKAKHLLKNLNEKYESIKDILEEISV